jgi:transcriptional regulator NrdR family protein
MKCPYCGSNKGSRVSDTRKLDDGINRVRICFTCHRFYTTTEAPDDLSIQPTHKKPYRKTA